MIAENFVLSADMNWSSASMKANWFASGCGFVYGLLSDQTENLTFLGLDGYVYSMGWLKGQRKPFAYQKWGSPTLPEGSARAMLVVYDKDVTIYVNGEKANHFYNSGYSPGFLALTVVSGTNAGYGTRCAMKNIEYWLFY